MQDHPHGSGKQTIGINSTVSKMLHLEEKLVTLLQKEQELNVNGP